MIIDNVSLWCLSLSCQTMWMASLMNLNIKRMQNHLSDTFKRVHWYLFVNIVGFSLLFWLPRISILTQSFQLWCIRKHTNSSILVNTIGPAFFSYRYKFWGASLHCFLQMICIFWSLLIKVKVLFFINCSVEPFTVSMKIMQLFFDWFFNWWSAETRKFGYQCLLELKSNMLKFTH